MRSLLNYFEAKQSLMFPYLHFWNEIQVHHLTNFRSLVLRYIVYRQEVRHFKNIILYNKFSITSNHFHKQVRHHHYYRWMTARKKLLVLIITKMWNVNSEFIQLKNTVTVIFFQTFTVLIKDDVIFFKLKLFLHQYFLVFGHIFRIFITDY